jgi:hypothetical protein
MKLYQGAIDYAEHSAYLFNDTNLDKVSKLMADGLAFYKGNGETIRSATIEALCSKCMNTGEIKVYKGIIGRIKPCDCNKQYANERIEVIQ